MKKTRRHEIGRKDGTDCSRSCYGRSIHVHQGRRRKPQKEGRLVQQRDRRCLRWLNAWSQMYVDLNIELYVLRLANTDMRPDRSAPAVFGYGAALSVVLAAFTFTGGKLTGYERDPTVDEVSRKEYLRKNRRRPVDEIVNELGEGRGTHMMSRGVARESELGLLTCTQESLLPVTRSVGPSASRPTTASTCRSPLHRRYVPYTQQYYSPCSNVLSLLRFLLRHGSSSEEEQYFRPRISTSDTTITRQNSCFQND